MLEILFPGIKEGQYTLLIILSCISVALWLLIAVARWSMFTKMGEKGWKAFIPFYDIYILFSKSGAQGRHGTTSRGFLFPCSLNSEFLNPPAILR